jgi:enoyl-CoA hydratase/carnithine racemase
MTDEGAATVGYETILVERRGPAAVVTFNRPHVLNAFDATQRAETASVLRELGQSSSGVRCIVLRGAGRAFSAGQDLSELHGIEPSDVSRSIQETWAPLWSAIRGLEIPLVAVVTGLALGGGLQIAMAADICVADTRAKLSLSEIDIGLPAITGVTLLWNHAPLSAIKYLSLTGDWIDAYEARRIGLVARAVEEADLERELDALVERLCAKEPVAVAINKRWWDQLTTDLVLRGEAMAECAHMLAHAKGGPKGRLGRFARDGAAL